MPDPGISETNADNSTWHTHNHPTAICRNSWYNIVMPTQLQTVVIGKALEAIQTGKKPNISKMMIESGYSKNSAKSPDVVTRSKAYKELVEQTLPIREALAVHRDAYSATKWNEFTGEREKDHAISVRHVLV
mgnify:CR=1 FL=1